MKRFSLYSLFVLISGFLAYLGLGLTPLGNDVIQTRYGADRIAIDAEQIRTILATLSGILIPWLAKNHASVLQGLRDFLDVKGSDTDTQLAKVVKSLDQIKKKLEIPEDTAP